MQIRRATKDNCGAVYALGQTAFPDENWSISQYESACQAQNSLFFTAWNKDNFAGFIQCDWYGDDVHLNLIACAPAYQRQGVAKALIAAAAQAVNAPAIFTLEVRAGNAVANSLYQSVGFAPQGVRKNFYHNPTEHGVVYLKEIH